MPTGTPDIQPASAAAVAPAYLLTHLTPTWLESLTPAELAILPWCFDLWLRPEQHIPTHQWRTCGFTGGRGFGKSMTIARWINARVMAGLETNVGLMAPTEPRVEEVCFKSLIDYAEPWQRPVPVGKTGLRWPNGVEAVGFTPEREGRSRGGNHSLSWCTEIVDWKSSSRLDAFKNLDTATRVGPEGGRIIWDSTAKGRNEVRTLLEEWHDADPDLHVLMPGTMFDNPGLSSVYLRSQWLSYSGVRRDEELLGASYRESAGALWTQASFDRTRMAELPSSGLEWMCVAIDPAISTTHDSADDTGIAVGGRGRDGHAYATEDLTGRHTAREWADIALDHADPRKPAPGGGKRGRIVVERKHLGEAAAEVLKGRAESRGLRLRVLTKDEPWPMYDPGCVFVREQNTNLSKGTRAEGPAVETESGRVHLVDPGYPDLPRFADLEKECTTYVPGVTKRSPNRLDAFAYLVIELRELRLDSAPDHSRDAAAAARLHEELQARLRGGTGGGALRGAAGGVGTTTARGGRRLGF